MRPFLKWAGNKYQIIDHIKEVLPKGKRLIEPFAGSCAVFLNTNYSRYLIADQNEDLINLYQQLKKGGKDFIHYCKTFFTALNNTEEKFYESRDLFNTTKDPFLKPGLFLYLNRHGYNGLCRYNSKGKFNVPFGRYRKPYFPEEEMFFFYKKLKKASLRCADFEDTMNKYRQGDVIYCDPPYVPLSKTAHFTRYHHQGFDETCQLKLAKKAEELSNEGITIIISNHDTDFTKQAYEKAKIKKLSVRRSISCNITQRKNAKEVLAVFEAKSI